MPEGGDEETKKARLNPDGPERAVMFWAVPAITSAKRILDHETVPALWGPDGVTRPRSVRRSYPCPSVPDSARSSAAGGVALTPGLAVHEHRAEDPLTEDAETILDALDLTPQ